VPQPSVNPEAAARTSQEESSLRDELMIISAELRHLRTATEETRDRVRFLEDFLHAVRRELNGSIPARLLRAVLGRKPSGKEGDHNNTDGWHEDFVRVYSPTECFNEDGKPQKPTDDNRRNYLNHVKFYQFAAQFVKGATILDAGCGSGYGCAMLADAGAARVCGCDLSEHALAYARAHHGKRVEFSRNSVTQLDAYSPEAFDLVICSEVLEHLEETGEVDAALGAMKRVAKPGALFLLATPNVELLKGHGFEFSRLNAICRNHFREVLFFENALIPFRPDAVRSWLGRRNRGETGTIVTEEINMAETQLPPGVDDSEDLSRQVKSGIPAGIMDFGGTKVDTARLHNTHSFLILARGKR
jgi:2-polyprenyl-3-methyl-5-hydroxy-6-metoxy-1,4-benzoquinol methylase